MSELVTFDDVRCVITELLAVKITEKCNMNIAYWLNGFREEKLLNIFPETPMLKLCPLMAAILDEGQTHRKQF